jgi:8-oxo-dGTP diphosphatase
MIGAGIILLNSSDEVLLLLRDNKIDIPFPDMWDIPGGKVEKGEDPEFAVRREIKEELGIYDLGDIDLFKIITLEKITNYIFWKKIDLNPDEIGLMEGQRIEYFDINRIKETELAFGFTKALEQFYADIIDKNKKI